MISSCQYHWLDWCGTSFTHLRTAHAPSASTDMEQAKQFWEDIDRLDVRPEKGMLKVRSKNRWEIQLDTATGQILQVALRRSDLIESLHDGSFFSNRIKMIVFLPTALVLVVLWGTGVYLFFLPQLAKRKKRLRKLKPNRS